MRMIVAMLTIPFLLIMTNLPESDSRMGATCSTPEQIQMFNPCADISDGRITHSTVKFDPTQERVK